MIYKISCSFGEIVDKYIILKLKKQNTKDNNSLQYIDLELWYDDDTLNRIKNEAIMEIKAYSYLKHISFLEARHLIYAVN